MSVDADGKQTSLKDKTIGEAASLMRGPVGTALTLSLARQTDDELVSIRLERAPLELEGVSASTYAPFIGKLVPDLELSSLDGTSTEKLSEHRGKVVVVDCWASWCATCYQPVTKLQKIAKEHPEWAGKVELITVTVDADLSSAIVSPVSDLDELSDLWPADDDPDELLEHTQGEREARRSLARVLKVRSAER